ncbi:MAG: ThiF family adenylyltransferase [Acidimicrobiia bacterium]|nr:ThiF family adenylyltransferase [Acidimicrobiia bacterium]
MTRATSVALTGATHARLCEHLLRDDGQEDLCLATYRASSGRNRATAILRDVILPQPGERDVHGNVTFTGEYVLRATEIAARTQGGIVVLHSHPGATRWQSMSGPDRDAESSYANLARELTGLPLVGMTLAGRDRTWSARHWDTGVGRDIAASPAHNVRVIGATLDISWNDRAVPAPRTTGQHRRTVSCWGEEVQADLARRRVLVVGVGSVGLDVAVRLAASGLTSITVMDFDIVKEHNLDRLIGATRRDVALRRAKTHVVGREARRNSTAANARIEISNLSICEPEGLAVALDHDVIFCCVDRPWPRAVLNGIAYSDLIPVVDGGVAVDTMPSGTLRNATWRSHVVAPGRPCLLCNRQLDAAQVALDMDGLLDDPDYIAGRAGHPNQPAGQNVAMVSINAAASLLAQYISLSVGPAGMGDPGPLQYLLSTHELLHLDHPSNPHCPYEAAEAEGNKRTPLVGAHSAADHLRASHGSDLPLKVRALRLVDDRVDSIERWLDRRA